MLFEYMSRTVSDAQIDIDDIGNCALIATTMDMDTYSMVIKTVLGVTEIYSCGPIGVDGDLGDYYSTTYRKFPYSESKIKNAITKFINTDGIMQVVDTDNVQSALHRFVNIATRYTVDEQ